MMPRGSQLLIALALSTTAHAVDKIVFEADEIVLRGARVERVEATLDLHTLSQDDGALRNARQRNPTPLTPAQSKSEVGKTTSPTFHARAAHARLAQSVGAFHTLAFDCTDLVIQEPVFACRAAHVSAKGGPTAGIEANAFAAYNSDSSSLRFAVNRFAIAGGSVRLDGSFVDDRWTMNAYAMGLRPGPLRILIKPWLTIPDTLAVSGQFDAQLQAKGRDANVRIAATLRTNDFGLSNEESTIVAEKVAASVSTKIARSTQGLVIDVSMDSTSGQALAGPVLLDFGANPLNLVAHGTLRDQILQLDALSISQRNLLNARGDGRVTLGAQPSLAQAHVRIDHLELPAAYASFGQLTLATTGFGALQTSGRISGSVDVENNRPKDVAVKLEGINLEDKKGKFSIADVRGDVHWIDDAKVDARTSYLSWRRGSAYGLSGGEARLDFRAQGFNVELTRESRVPILDGAVLIRSLALRDLGQPSAEFNFDAQIEPISMPLLSKAFGWPELQGELSGRIPGLSYRNRELTVEGDLSARVFDGTIVGRNFRLRDPLGPWPRLFSDITARRLDLELVTRTFPIGNITGRLDADIKGLELFNWSPVAFEARLYTTPGDRSKHLISQKAVTSISNVGGGSGGVTATLQSGFLRFFDNFRYDRIGLGCRLRNDVCVMAGVEPAGMGYYIVKGKGLPRIDIIGNQGRVDWPLLVSQITAGMQSNDIVVR